MDSADFRLDRRFVVHRYNFAHESAAKKKKHVLYAICGVNLFSWREGQRVLKAKSQRLRLSSPSGAARLAYREVDERERKREEHHALRGDDEIDSSVFSLKYITYIPPLYIHFRRLRRRTAKKK